MRSIQTNVRPPLAGEVLHIWRQSHRVRAYQYSGMKHRSTGWRHNRPSVPNCETERVRQEFEAEKQEANRVVLQSLAEWLPGKIVTQFRKGE